ncbi:GrpB family protein [Alkaliphilus peptidifermentans]|uniref:GrpB domain, predicted nucleotidyltransferase, UPF0157 family n=1 Tax=Alkaliphilus peptidifermentans DSM 18978 TaxID=1120976 RepID=A0A1G5D717_9FIRM|nr:GrpB family protein [Alkaliphilus peptidifermentans]SCY10482.1 GrpB domain, predicted nucleotidyltransferase, UPF0157 family [Alkaliphilus peptidifermentans DSM 18978]
MVENQQVRIIEVVPYNPEWKEAFERESSKLKIILSEEIIDIHHVGSTSIPGISAKPVIDILIEVKDISKINSYNKLMENEGYIAKGEYGLEGRRFFLKGIYNRTHHIHIYQVGNPEVTRHLNFRDYMIAHPKDAAAYGDLKNQLVEKFKHDIDGYCDGKDAFIKDIEIKSKEWAKKIHFIKSNDQ